MEEPRTTRLRVLRRDLEEEERRDTPTEEEEEEEEEEEDMIDVIGREEERDKRKFSAPAN